MDDKIGLMEPQNIGVSSVDHNVDRTAGARAEEQWAHIEKRQSHKQNVLRQNPGTTGFDLSATPDGDYRVMKKEERKVKDDFRKFHNQKLVELARQRRAGIA